MSDLAKVLAELGPEAAARHARLAAWSPFYADVLRRQPELVAWLEDPRQRDEEYRPSAFRGAFTEAFPLPPEAPAAAVAAALRRFRQRQSLRIAWREVGGLATVETSWRELSRLADFVLQTLFTAVRRQLDASFGVPWDDLRAAPGRFCVLALGKHGGHELNFCSDLDLVFVSDGPGQVHRSGRETALAAAAAYQRLAQELARRLSERTADGWLYHVDLRLRPEGAEGPLVRSLDSMEAYYWTAGQTWERLALLRVRPVAGDLDLGEEFVETIHSFRYPRRPPPALLDEVAATKRRTEREVVGGEDLARHLKSGPGGIREVEFFVQGQQLLHAGGNPFLQTASIPEALARLERYRLVDPATAAFLREAYAFFRAVENRLQMRDERQTHLLPALDAPEWPALAASLGLSPAGLAGELERRRARVREIYHSLFPAEAAGEDLHQWQDALSGLPPAPAFAARLEGWFRRPAGDIVPRLRQFLTGAPHHLLTAEHVRLADSLAAEFDRVLPRLARPMRALERLSTFAERYGARLPFLRSLQGAARVFESTTLLFDRSTFVFDLLCRRPDIFDELLATGWRMGAATARMADELERLPGDREFPRRLRGYVAAEQVRLASAHLLGACDAPGLELALSHLADCVLRRAAVVAGLEANVGIIALGKLGGRELTLGSDLDLMFVALGDEAPTAGTRALLQLLGGQTDGPRAFAVDVRLRPFGGDGPLVATLGALADYHRGGPGRPWERQMLLRARPVAGPPELREAFLRLRDDLTYGRPPGPDEHAEAVRLRALILREKARCQPPQLAFKAGPGGLLDIEYPVQLAQWAAGGAHPAVRQTSTRRALAALGEAGVWPTAKVDALAAGYDFLRGVELALRRESATAASVLDPADEQLRLCLPFWLGFRDWEAFQAELMAVMARVAAAGEA